MNYFIDFEATQFSNRIISVGVVKETGETFYSLINPDREITSFITKLTGITQEELDSAPNADEVFSDLYDFCKDDADLPVFYCYGNSDKVFVQDTFNKMITSFKAGCMLGFLRAGLTDFSPIVKSHFGIANQISLIKVYNYYKDETTDQKHNALEDSEMLKFVFEQINIHENEFDAFPEYKVQKAVNKTIQKEKNVNNYKVYRFKGDRMVETYACLEDAVSWLLEHKFKKNEIKDLNLHNVAKKLKSAGLSNGEKKYFSVKWLVTPY